MAIARAIAVSAILLSALISQTVTAQTAPSSIKMKLLVISADGNEPVFAGIKSILDGLNVPYDTLVASQTPLTAQTLSDGKGNGHYQGILLTTGNLAYTDSSGVWQSALTSAQWQTLWQYESAFRVRQATMYTYPAGQPDNYGLANPVAIDTSNNAVAANLTTAGKQVFNYLNPNSPVMIKNAWTYLAQPAPTNSGSNFTTLLTTSAGNPIASIFTYTDGRQNLAITSDGNPELVHTLSLGYGVINWLTKGFFLGERKVYMNPQPDDVLLDNDIWDVTKFTDTSGITYRITGSDYVALIAWQKQMNAANPNNAMINLEMPFNAIGASGIYRNDTLTPAIKKNSLPFKWISHTWEHANLDSISAADALYQLKQNDNAARQSLKLTRYHTDSMIQPDISGLANATFLTTAFQFGIRNILSDTSVIGWKSSIPNAGFYSTHVNTPPGMMIIPRYPTNLYYNVTTPAEWISEYNYFYGPTGLWPTWDHNLSYAEVLDKESTIMLSYLLKYHINPLMFHQANLRAYNGANNLLGDLITATLNKYHAIFKLPIVSPSQHDIAAYMASRMAFNAAGVRGTLLLNSSGNSIVLTSNNAAKVPVTGIASGTNHETYGGQAVSTISLSAGATVTIPAPAW